MPGLRLGRVLYEYRTEVKVKIMWAIYEELIAAVPSELKVQECLVGLHWILVRSRATGVAMTPLEGHPRVGLAGKIEGMPVRELAEYLKSWNNLEAALGLAAINSVFNAPERVEELCGRPLNNQPQVDAFTYFQEQVRGKKVTVVGHFPNLEPLARNCRLAVLERRPREGDLPDSACEYILPEQEYVFITATTLINKTLPRLLELSRQARVVLLGPSTPMTPLLFRYGIDTLAGTVIVDPGKVWRVVREGGCQEIFQYGGRMVQVTREMVNGGEDSRPEAL
ncbi:MAG: Rossmann-like domain-containing protein [Moorellaceae bacterium]